MLALVAAVFGLAAAPAPAPAKASKSCYPRGADALTSGIRVRVFALTDPEYEARTVFYACALRSGRRFELGDSYTDTNVSFNLSAIRITGLTVAFQTSECISGPTCGSSVRSLQDWHVVLREAATV